MNIPIENIGGPSAGLMLTLGIIDKVKPEDLTGGKIIAGTGTIDDDGNVGPIGGVPQKLVGAKDAGATFFLTPRTTAPRRWPTRSRAAAGPGGDARRRADRAGGHPRREAAASVPGHEPSAGRPRSQRR